jgi:hypothetical protein
VAQVFPPGANWLARWSIILVVVGGGVITAVASAVYWGPAVTQKGVHRNQPVPFSHQRHVQGNGMDCRYCHTTVETSAFAGIPPTETCMTCHSQIFTEQSIFKPVTQSWSSGAPIEWARVNDLPDFAYFNHSIHVNKGIGCTECHGQVDEMRLTYKAETLHMMFCTNCHRAPEKYIRPKDEVFNMDWKRPANQLEMGRELVKEYNVRVGQLINCSICHR